MNIFHASLLTISLAAAATPALADKGGNGHHKKNHSERSYKGESHARDNFPAGRSDSSVIVIDNGDRTVIREYLGTHYGRACPPGLAKKNNGCLPPGQAKKYRIGETLDPDVTVISIPADLRGRLAPVPAGYEYVQVDRDVLLISEGTRKVVDAITLLSAVGD